MRYNGEHAIVTIMNTGLTVTDVLPCLSGMLSDAVEGGRKDEARALAVAVSLLTLIGRGSLTVNVDDLRSVVEQAVGMAVDVGVHALVEGWDGDERPMVVAGLLVAAMEPEG